MTYESLASGSRDIRFPERLIDPFGRQRVSNPINLWRSEFQYNLHPLYFDEVTAVNGAVTHLPNESAASLAVTADNGSKAIMQTFEYLRYQPGEGHDCVMTFIADSMTSTTVKFVRRTKTSGSVVDNKTAQAAWNKDKFDGSGPSGVVLDIAKGQILHIDLQWLSLGVIAYGFEVNRVLHYAHFDDGSNALTVPITTTANLPVRWEIVSDATNTTMRVGYFDDDNGFFVEIQGAVAIKTLTAICSSVYSEGGDDDELGHTFSGGNGATTRAVGNATPVPVCSIRPATTLNSITNRIKWRLETIELLSDADIFWELHYQGTITAESFAAAVAHSATEVDIAGTSIASGIIIDSGYVASGVKSSALGRDIKTKFPIALDSAGTDQSRGLSIVALKLTAGTANVAAQFNWVEIR